jgi:hypothetical protein
MQCVQFGFVFFGKVALGTKRIARCTQFQTVGFMTVRTGDTGLMHFALQERTVDIHLAIDL